MIIAEAATGTVLKDFRRIPGAAPINAEDLWALGLRSPGGGEAGLPELPGGWTRTGVGGRGA